VLVDSYRSTTSARRPDAYSTIVCGLRSGNNIASANFPAWMICAIAGITLTPMLRTLFVAIRIEAHLGPLMIVYSSLAMLLSCQV
jgi:hypothetical protein